MLTPSSSLKLISPPSVEPITTAEAKLFARVDSSDEDALIAALITAAREQVEAACSRALITQTWESSYESFPSCGYFTLPRPELQSVTHIKYRDTVDGTLQTLSTSNYQVLTDFDPGQVRVINTVSHGSYKNAIQVRFVGGYGDAATDLPETIKTALKMAVAFLYGNREAEDLPSVVYKMLWNYKAQFTG